MMKIKKLYLQIINTIELNLKIKKIMKDNTTIIREKCHFIEKTIIGIYDLYKTSSIQQQRLIETTIGASLFYISSKKAYWTGFISEEAIKNKSEKLTMEHQYPRKIAARELLNMAEALKNKETSVFELFEEKYAKFNYVTSSENTKLRKFQNDKNFIDVESSYKNAGVKLVPITENELKKYKKGSYFKRVKRIRAEARCQKELRDKS